MPRRVSREVVHRLISRPHRRESRALRTAVRTGATAAVAAALVVPFVRRRLRLPAGVTTAVLASGPVGLAVLRPRTRGRDAALYAFQMWGFVMTHELPYDDPEALRRRLRIEYPIRIDQVLGLGELPSVRLQRALGRRGEVATLDRVLTVVHWAWFFEPHVAMAYLLARHDRRFPRAARQLAATYDLGCAVYFALPTAPPWWAGEQGHLDGEVERIGVEVGSERVPAKLRRIMVDVGEGMWGRAWPTLYDSLGGNPWAAMPSLHFATSLMAAMLLAEAGPAPGAAGWAYAGALGFALVYLGEHYLTDLVAGVALVAAVRAGEPLAAPVVMRVVAAVESLGRLATE